MGFFWTSFISGNYHDEGCTVPPFEVFVVGYGKRENTKLSLRQISKLADPLSPTDFLQDSTSAEKRFNCRNSCFVQAVSEEDAVNIVQKFFPDATINFCEERDKSFNPRDGYVETQPGGIWY